MLGLTGMYNFFEDTGLGFYSICGIHRLWELLLASSVGERNADSWVPCPSPHWDNHWSPGVIRIAINCGAELSTDDHVIPNFHRKQGDRVIQLKAETRGWVDCPLMLIGKCCYHYGWKVLGSLSLGRKVSCLMLGLSLVPHPCLRVGRDGGQGRTQPANFPTHPTRIDGGRGASIEVSPIPTPLKQGKVVKVVS